MSDTETPTTTDGPEVEPTTEETPREPQDGSGKQMPREQRYRLELRAAEAARDALSQRVERMQRAEVERLAADGLSHPADLFSLSGNDLVDYLTEDGDVDAEKVAADVAAVLAERPGLRKNAPAFDPSQGHGGRPQAKREPSWGAVFQ
jgi:hypothetical protein